MELAGKHAAFLLLSTFLENSVAFPELPRTQLCHQKAGVHAYLHAGGRQHLIWERADLGTADTLLHN